MSEKVKVTLCIGLIGVCIISIESDSDGVFDDINQRGAEEWHERLPSHDVPVIEGIYSIEMEVSFYEDDIVYEITGVAADE